ncbi:MAG: hypothetical protein ACXVYA_12055, partial [Mycobacterium sp.]
RTASSVGTSAWGLQVHLPLRQCNDGGCRGLLSPQQRATQSCVNRSRSSGTGPGGRDGARGSRNAAAASEVGNGDPIDGGDERAHVGGRSRVIHAFLVVL